MSKQIKTFIIISKNFDALTFLFFLPGFNPGLFHPGLNKPGRLSKTLWPNRSEINNQCPDQSRTE